MTRPRHIGCAAIALLALAFGSCAEPEVREPTQIDSPAVDAPVVVPSEAAPAPGAPSSGGEADVSPERERDAATDRQGPGRIRFAPGATATTVHGRLGPERDTTMVLYARKGQSMRVRVDGTTENRDVVIAISGPSGITITDDADVTTEWSGVLPATGEYRITVGMIESEFSEFSLEVAIE